MPDVVLKCIFAILAVIGTVEVIRAVWRCILKTKNQGKLVLMLPLTGHEEQAEAIIRSAMDRTDWIGGGAQVVCLDCGMDIETRRICEIICADNPEIILCTPEEFQKFWIK
jgi:hypothetical protein